MKIKELTTIAFCLLVFTMNGQVKNNIIEVNTRPVSDLLGVINAGVEIQTGKKSSILIDAGAGTSVLDESTLSTFLVGARLYFTSESSAARRELLKKSPLKPLSGTYVTARHRSRFYSSDTFGDRSYGANTNVMIGKKIMIDNLSIAGEAGVGRQTVYDVTNVFPTYSITVGYRLSMKK